MFNFFGDNFLDDVLMERYIEILINYLEVGYFGIGGILFLYNGIIFVFRFDYGGFW